MLLTIKGGQRLVQAAWVHLMSEALSTVFEYKVIPLEVTRIFPNLALSAIMTDWLPLAGAEVADPGVDP
jgi:hypothetical protein